MSRLSADDRRALPPSDFAGPGRSFPIPDKGHARAALSDLPRAEAKGSVTPGQAASIRAKAHAELADRHLALHAHHSALAHLHKEKGDAEIAAHHHEIGGHHMHIAKAHDEISGASKFPSRGAGYEGSPADERQDAAGAKAAGESRESYEGSAKDRREDAAGGDPLAKGAAAQLLRKGHIDQATHDRIAGGGDKPAAKPKKRPFGSLAGAGHYMGDVDASSSGGSY